MFREKLTFFFSFFFYCGVQTNYQPIKGTKLEELLHRCVSVSYSLQTGDDGCVPENIRVVSVRQARQHKHCTYLLQ